MAEVGGQAKLAPFKSEQRDPGWSVPLTLDDDGLTDRVHLIHGFRFDARVIYSIPICAVEIPKRVALYLQGWLVVLCFRARACTMWSVTDSLNMATALDSSLRTISQKVVGHFGNPFAHMIGENTSGAVCKSLSPTRLRLD